MCSPQPHKRLIVNADDLGRTPGINTGIFEAHERGLVTSATLMVGFPPAEEAAERWLRTPGIGVGLHVALTGGRPLLPVGDVPSLVDEEGRFPAKPEGLSRARSDEVMAEVEAQLERFRALTGRLPTHLDSHHHSHRLPVVLDALVSLARRHDLPVRKTSAEVGEHLHREGIATSSVFVEDFFGDGARLEVLLQILETLMPGTTELMCHPARVDEALRRDSSYVDERERELALLTHPEAIRAVRENRILLTHFGEL
jgi:predicted glycoside hydrolase/deacetylase ChbG (UPF0249 family)